MLVAKKKLFLKSTICLFILLIISKLVFAEPHISSEQKTNNVSSQGTKIYKIDLKEAYADRSREKGLYQFQRKDGTLVFTNRPQKYRSKSEYKEVYFKKSPNTQQTTKKETNTKDSTENSGYAIIVPLEPVHVSKKFEHLYKGKTYNFETIQKIVKECSQYYQVDEKLIWARKNKRTSCHHNKPKR